MNRAVIDAAIAYDFLYWKNKKVLIEKVPQV